MHRERHNASANIDCILTVFWY